MELKMWGSELFPSKPKQKRYNLKSKTGRRFANPPVFYPEKSTAEWYKLLKFKKIL